MTYVINKFPEIAELTALAESHVIDRKMCCCGACFISKRFQK